MARDNVHGTRKASGNASLGGKAQTTDWNYGTHQMKLDVQDKSRKLHGPSVNSSSTRSGNSSAAIKVLGPRVA